MLFLLLLVGLALGNPIRMAKSMLADKRGSDPLQYIVAELPGLMDNIEENDRPLMHAGQLELYKENNTHYFFWKFADQNKAPEAENKTIFWLNGGPGCSSMDGALMEAGPLRIDKHGNVVYNAGSWHKKGDIVFVDQPAGTGFSYTDAYDTELYQIKYDFLRFLQKYYELFPEQRGYEIMLAGESYAGQYIPYIASGILDYNRNAEEKYNLKGLVIGNGWISPNVQSLLYVPFAVQAGIISTNHPRWQDLLNQHMQCQNLVDGAKPTDTFGANHVVDQECDRVLSVLLQVTRDTNAANNQQCFNMYDYTLKDLFPSCGMNWPPDLEYVYPFLRQDSVMSLLHIEHTLQWHECDLNVGSNLRARHLEPSITLFPSLLLEIPIILFHGNRDIICNYIGAEDMIKQLEWGGLRGYSDDVVVYDWLYNDTVLGYIKSERNLTFVNVFEASHMVPFDKPDTSRALIDILYDNVEKRQDKDNKPQMVTWPIGHKADTEESAALESEEAVSDAVESSASESASLEFGAFENGTPLNSTDTENNTTDASTPESHTSRIVRLIQLAVIVVVVWGMCALYNTYRSKPTSIIKTKPSGKKKNVLWADQLDEQEAQPESFILKAFHKITGKEGYASVPGDIEMGSTSGEHDDFIIASDDEEPARE